jgi:hypothetical protein
VTTSDWITLVGAIGSLLAAGFAAIAAFLALRALRQIAEERRRTFNLGLLVELSKALTEKDGGPALEHCKLLLRMLPLAYMPSLRGHWGQPDTSEVRDYYWQMFKRSPADADWSTVLEKASIELGIATADLLGQPG